MTSAPEFTLDDTTRTHLVGIGGAGMSALAIILLERGLAVSGSDLRGGRACAALSAMGARVATGHDAANVGDAGLVVASTAIPDTNPEIRSARERGIPVLRRADLLALLMRGHRRLLVAGTHGKTTTTSLVTVCLQSAGLDPSFAIGGTLNDSGTSAHAGADGVFVAEADESDESFLALRPDCAVVTNLELDHHDHYTSLDQVRVAFLAFLSQRSQDGPAIVCRDDPGAAGLLAEVPGPVVTYGEHEESRVRVGGIELAPSGSSFTLASDGEQLGRFGLRVPGRHNILNAAGAAAAALWAGASPEAIRDGLAAFGGAQRRFQRIGKAAGVTVVDDYGHHPTEIAATLQAARQVHPDGRIIAVFQPHRYSRTAALGAELGAALAGADIAVVTDVYAAGEVPVPGVDGAVVADAARAAGVDVLFVAQAGQVPERVAEIVTSGDLVLTLGAGDITEVGPVLLRLLEGQRG